MAKKSKARKSKVRKVEKVTPTYLEPGKGFTIGLHDVVRAVKAIEKNKLLNKFVSAAKREKKKAIVRMDADCVNFVKDFIVKHGMHKDRVGKHIVNASVPAAPASGPTVEAAGATEARDRFRPCTFSGGG